MPVQTKCTNCKRPYTLADNLLGRRVRCKNCGVTFEVQPLEPMEAIPAPPIPAGSIRTGSPRVKRREAVEDDEDDYDDEEEEDRPRRRRKRKTAKQSSPVMWIVGIGAGVVSFIIAFLVVTMLMRRPTPPGAGPVVMNRDRPVVPPVAQPPVLPPPVQQAAPAPAPAPPAPVPAPAPEAKIPPPGEEPPGLYGDQGGDEIAPADPGLPDTILRARADDTFYRLSNPRLGRPRFGPGEAILVDYEVVHRGKHGGANLVIHGGDGRRTPVSLLFFGRQDRDTIEVKTFGPFGGLPKNAELYLTRSDGRYGRDSPTFKVSNSVTIGVMPTTTKARNWTKAEIDRFTKPPPNYTAFNLHPNVGQDTPFVGDTGGVSMRYVEPNGQLLGLEYRLAEWDKEKCIGGLTAIFSRDQPTTLPDRVLAREGYAVAGVEVHTGKFVDGVKLLFQRLKPDGSFDPADNYASDLIGYSGKTQTLGNDGRRVQGINCRQGAILNALALVMEKK